MAKKTEKQAGGIVAAQRIDADRERRGKQLTDIIARIAILEPQLDDCNHNQHQLDLLDSVSRGLYDEIDKLAKKAPAEPLTDLALEQVNEIIRETKELIASDPYIRKLNRFVPAGDNPQQRDAVIVLRQIRQGLERYHKALESLTQQVKTLLREALGVRVALELYLAEQTLVRKEVMKDYGIHAADAWFSGYPETFNFAKLDRVKIPEYFAAP
jgi:hypothetical protein